MNNSNRDEYLLKLQKTQSEFYKTQAKKMVFKQEQKKACANYVTTNGRIEDLIECTVFIVPNTNILFFDYPVFKTYGNPETSKPLYVHIIKVIETILSTYDTFEFHINLKTFSVSACHRYYSMIVCSVDTNQIFTEKLSKLVIYNTPFIIDQITRLLYNTVKSFLHKTEYVKEHSEERISQLLKDVV